LWLRIFTYMKFKHQHRLHPLVHRQGWSDLRLDFMSLSFVCSTAQLFLSEDISFFSVLPFAIYLFLAFSPQIPNFLPFLAVLWFICWSQLCLIFSRPLFSDLVCVMSMCKVLRCCNLCIDEQLMYNPKPLQFDCKLSMLWGTLKFFLN